MELQKRNGQRTNRGRVSVISMKQKTKTKQKQISKIEETNIFIENLKTQNKNKSNLNPFNKKNKNKNNISYPNLKNGKKKIPEPVLTVADVWLNGFFLCACSFGGLILASDPNCSKHKS